MDQTSAAIRSHLISFLTPLGQEWTQVGSIVLPHIRKVAKSQNLKCSSLGQIILLYPETFDLAKQAKGDLFVRIKKSFNSPPPVPKPATVTTPSPSSLNIAISLLQNGPMPSARLQPLIQMNMHVAQASGWFNRLIDSNPSVFALTANPNSSKKKDRIITLRSPNPPPPQLPANPNPIPKPQPTSAVSSVPLPHPNPSPAVLPKPNVLPTPEVVPKPPTSQPTPKPIAQPVPQPMVSQPRANLPNPLIVISPSSLDECSIIKKASRIGIDCEFTQPHCHLSLVQISLDSQQIFILDCLSEYSSEILEFVSSILASREIIKVFHGFQQDIQVLRKIGMTPENVLDTQVLYGVLESVKNTMNFPASVNGIRNRIGLNNLLQTFGFPVNPEKETMNQREWHKRPLTPAMIRYASEDVKNLIPLSEVLFDEIHNETETNCFSLHSLYLNPCGGTYANAAGMVFDQPYFMNIDSEFRVQREEHSQNSEKRSTFVGKALNKELLDVLPEQLAQEIVSNYSDKLESLWEIVIDMGKNARLRWTDETEDTLPFKVDVATAVGELQRNLSPPGELYTTERGGPLFSSDNRTGIDGTLHRISCIRNRRHEIIGLTYRLGRWIEGAIYLIEDLVMDLVASSDKPPKSMCVVGAPGKGKTSILREIIRYLSDMLKQRVVIVDSSDEIAGPSCVPHACIGDARRMSVPDRNEQHHIMIEAVQNHSPQFIVIDEIGTKAEVAAVKTICQRGVGVIGTAHGIDLHSLLSNPELVDLVGGIKTVTLGDRLAEKKSKGKANMKKDILERAHIPPFHYFIEIVDKNHVKIFRPLWSVVDDLLGNKACSAEERWIDENGFVRSRFFSHTCPAEVADDDLFFKKK